MTDIKNPPCVNIQNPHGCASTLQNYVRTKYDERSLLRVSVYVLYIAPGWNAVLLLAACHTKEINVLLEEFVRDVTLSLSLLRSQQRNHRHGVLPRTISPVSDINTPAANREQHVDHHLETCNVPSVPLSRWSMVGKCSYSSECPSEFPGLLLLSFI